MQSGHLWTSGPAEPAANDPKAAQGDVRPYVGNCGISLLTVSFIL
jgi:hypothetical protein